jgi:hypothetical protein
MNTDYKPNSHKSKQALPEKKVEKVIHGRVKTKPKGGISKVADAIVTEDVSNVKNYIFMDVLIPAVKKAISDIVREGIDMLLFGESRRDSRSRGYHDSVSYRDYTRSSSRSTSRDPGVHPRSKMGILNEDIILGSRGDAEAVLSRMDEIIDTYEVVTVMDLYDILGETAPYTADRYGWKNLASAEAIRVRDGYLLKLPRAIVID